MLRTLDFNGLPSGTIVDDEYADIGVTVSATGGSGDAMIFDSANPTGDDTDLASDTLEGLLIVSTDGDTSDPDDHDGGGTIFFDFETPAHIKFITIKDIEEGGGGIRFYNADGDIVSESTFFPGTDGDERQVSLNVSDVTRMEVVLAGSGAIDNLVFDDNIMEGEDPTAVDDAAETDIITPVIVDLRGNDTDPQDATSDLVISGVTSPDGTITDNGDGTIEFTPNAGFVGDAVIDYTVTDTGGSSDEGQAVVAVTDPVVVVDGPTAQDDFATTVEETEVVIDVRGNDFDTPGGSVGDFPSELTISNPVTADGLAVISSAGDITFTPAIGFTGDATITYTLTDTDGNTDEGTVLVAVTPDGLPNGAPVAVDDTASTQEDTVLEGIDVLVNDSDPDLDPLQVISATSPNGTVTINADNTLDFAPDLGFTGPATITYVVADGPAGDPDTLTDTGILEVTVNDDDDLDGFVDGGNADDLIDADYTGDPNGDRVDAIDEILPDAGPNDDFIRAFEGDDSVVAGEGDDSVLGGDGDDTVEGGDGNDTVNGGDGDDVINTGNGDLAPDLGYPAAATDLLSYDPDADPENDRDSVIGGAGNDTITTGDDRDTIRGNTGDDVIDGGIDDDIIDGGLDDDRIVGGEGNDSILGGQGNDTIYAGNDPDLGLDILSLPDVATDGFPLSPDRNPDNGQDTVDGGMGDDVIFGADDDDLLSGGAGADFVDGEIDDDTIFGNDGDDTLRGGQGDDVIEGNENDDDIEGGIGNDTLSGNRDEDTILGREGDDVIDGGADNDTLIGNEGDDAITGGGGDDNIQGGEGADTMTGGAGQDIFSDVSAGDVIDGGSGPVDNDTLDLRGSSPDGGRLEVTFTSADEEDGIVNYFNADDTDAGSLVFEEIETLIIPCFTPGTRIATPKGERLVEELQVGDRVITRDNGIQEIRWIGSRDMSGAQLQAAQHLRPVLIQKGALGNDLPERDMMVSPQHRVLIANDKTALYFEEREVLVAAKHLTDQDGIDVVDVSHTTYIHIMFDQHEVVLSDGSWSESFQPGDMTLVGIGDEQCQEILELFPELATSEGVEGYASARRSLKKFEAKLVTK